MRGGNVMLLNGKEGSGIARVILTEKVAKIH